MSGEPLICPTCGSAYWRRWEGGDYSERHSIDLSQGLENAAHDWNKQETNVMHSEPWTCENDHEASDEQADVLIEA